MVGPNGLGKMRVDVLDDVLRTFVRTSRRRFHDDVVTNALVNAQGLVDGHAMDPVTTLEFASRGHLGLAPNADPHDGQVASRRCEPSLRSTSVEEDLIEDHPDARRCDRRDPVSPGVLGPAKTFADGDRAIGTESQRATCRRVGRTEGQGTDQIVHSENQPDTGEDPLHALGE